MQFNLIAIIALAAIQGKPADYDGVNVDVTALLDSSSYDDGSDHIRVDLNLQNALSGRYGKKHPFLDVDLGNLIGGYHPEGYNGNNIYSYLALGGKKGGIDVTDIYSKTTLGPDYTLGNGRGNIIADIDLDEIGRGGYGGHSEGSDVDDEHYDRDEVADVDIFFDNDDYGVGDDNYDGDDNGDGGDEGSDVGDEHYDHDDNGDGNGHGNDYDNGYDDEYNDHNDYDNEYDNDYDNHYDNGYDNHSYDSYTRRDDRYYADWY